MFQLHRGWQDYRGHHKTTKNEHLKKWDLQGERNEIWREGFSEWSAANASGRVTGYKTALAKWRKEVTSHNIQFSWWHVHAFDPVVSRAELDLCVVLSSVSRILRPHSTHNRSYLIACTDLSSVAKVAMFYIVVQIPVTDCSKER